MNDSLDSGADNYSTNGEVLIQSLKEIDAKLKQLQRSQHVSEDQVRAMYLEAQKYTELLKKLPSAVVPKPALYDRIRPVSFLTDDSSPNRKSNQNIRQLNSKGQSTSASSNLLSRLSDIEKARGGAPSGSEMGGLSGISAGSSGGLGLLGKVKPAVQLVPGGEAWFEQPGSRDFGKGSTPPVSPSDSGRAGALDEADDSMTYRAFEKNLNKSQLDRLSQFRSRLNEIYGQDGGQPSAGATGDESRGVMRAGGGPFVSSAKPTPTSSPLKFGNNGLESGGLVRPLNDRLPFTQLSQSPDATSVKQRYSSSHDPTPGHFGQQRVSLTAGYPRFRVGNENLHQATTYHPHQSTSTQTNAYPGGVNSQSQTLGGPREAVGTGRGRDRFVGVSGEHFQPPPPPVARLDFGEIRSRIQRLKELALLYDDAKIERPHSEPIVRAPEQIRPNSSRAKMDSRLHKHGHSHRPQTDSEKGDTKGRLRPSSSRFRDLGERDMPISPRHARATFEIPFVAGTSTGQSHSMRANVQKLLATLKSQDACLTDLFLQLVAERPSLGSARPHYIDFVALSQAFASMVDHMIAQSQAGIQDMISSYDEIGNQMRSSADKNTAKAYDGQRVEMARKIECEDLNVQRLLALREKLYSLSSSARPSRQRTCASHANHLQTEPHRPDSAYSSALSSSNGSSSMSISSNGDGGNSAPPDRGRVTSSYAQNDLWRGGKRHFEIRHGSVSPDVADGNYEVDVDGNPSGALNAQSRNRGRDRRLKGRHSLSVPNYGRIGGLRRRKASYRGPSRTIRSSSIMKHTVSSRQRSVSRKPVKNIRPPFLAGKSGLDSNGLCIEPRRALNYVINMQSTLK